MMIPPAYEVVQGHPDYDYILAAWLADGRPDSIELLQDDCAYRAFNRETTVSFSLLAYSPGATTPDRSSPISGYGLAMGVVQRTWNGPRQLPKD